MKSTLCTILSVLFLSVCANATPYLQLDISNSVYDPSTETIVSTSNIFTLYALVNTITDPDDPDFDYDPEDEFYISIALTPKTDTTGDYGSFDFDGVTYDVTDNMEHRQWAI